jgi:adenylate cyclase
VTSCRVDAVKGLSTMSGTKSSDPTRRSLERRKLIAVAYADVVGYSHLIGLDDVGTLKRLRALRRNLIDPAIAEHGGRVVNTGGDSLLIEFDSIDGAVRCVIKIQEQVPAYDGNFPADRAIRFRMGINVGDVVPDGTDVHGSVVNVAARLQTACPSGDICISRAVRDHVQDRLDLVFEELGSLNLKNIGRPVEAVLIRIGAQKPRAATVAALMPDRSIAKAPRLSLVVLPFNNLSGNPNEDYFVDAITEDLTTDLSRIPDALVIGRTSAAVYKNSRMDARRVGEELGVRYVVEGSVRKLGAILRVNVQMISTESNTHLWATRFDQDISELGTAQDSIVRRIASSLGVEVVEVESERSARERPTSPDAFDLVLRARSLENQPTSLQRNDAAQALYEQALGIDPTSVRAIIGLFRILYLHWTDRGYWRDDHMRERAIALLASAQSIAPHDEAVMASTARLLEAQGNWQQMMVAAQRIIDDYPNSVYGYLYLARCKIFTGNSEEALPLLTKTIQINPRDPYLWDRYWRMGFALLLLGRYEESIIWHQRALAVYPDASPGLRSNRFDHMAAAWALSGHNDEARRAIAELNRIWPFATVRSHVMSNPSSEVYVTQIKRYLEGLRIAGLRDHAEEDADFGVAPDDVLHEDPIGLTPGTAPGVTTIRTMALRAFIGERNPILIDTTLYSWGYSIPGVVGLQNVGIGGDFSDSTQARLNRKMRTLTGGDLAKPIVAIGWNSERFDGRNLALRLAALGYTQVYWYRGGRESWEANGLPETALGVQDW